METLKVQMEDPEAKKFREKAMKIYGHSKGSISKAMNSAIRTWLDKTEGKRGRLKAKEIRGLLAGLKDSSLMAQRKSAKMMGSPD